MRVSEIFYVVLSIVSVLVTGVLIPLLKQKYGKEKVVSVIEAVDIAVKAAEQIYSKQGQGHLKKQYVLQRLKDQGIKVDSKELDDMIEASVLELNRWKKEIEQPGEWSLGSFLLQKYFFVHIVKIYKLC